MLLFLVGGALDMHRMTGCRAGNGAVPGKGQPIAIHLGPLADTVTESHTMALPAEGHRIGTKVPLLRIRREETLKLLPGQHVADRAPLRVPMGIAGRILCPDRSMHGC